MKRNANLVTLIEMIDTLKSERLDNRQIQKRFQIPERRTYRYLAILKDSGQKIERDRENRYFINS